METQNPIDDLFRTVGEPFEMEPTAKVWDSLDAQLEKRKADSYRKKFIFYKRLSLALLALLVSLSSYLFFNHENNSGTNSKQTNLAEQPSTQPAKNSAALTADHQSSGNTGTATSSSPNIVVQTDKSNSTVTFSNSSQQNNSPVISSGQKKNTSNNLATNNHATNGNHFTATVQNNTNDDKNNSGNNKNIAHQDATPFVSNAQSSSTTIADLFTFIPGKTILLSSSPKNNLSLSDINGWTIPPPAVPSKTFYVSGFFSPDYVKCSLKRNMDEDYGSPEDDHRQDEYYNFSFTTGLLGRMQVNNHWSFQSGLTFTSFSESIKPRTVYGEEDDDGNVQFTFATTEGAVKLPNNSSAGSQSSNDSVILSRDAKQSIQFINVPFTARYQLNVQKFSFYGFTGGSVNFLCGDRMSVSTNNENPVTIKNIDGLREMSYSFLAGMGMEYHFFGNFSVFGEPIYRRSITAINKNTPVKSYPNSFGINTGIAWRF